MKLTLTRREFILSSLAALGGTGIIGTAFYLRESSDVNLVVSILQDELSYLQLNQADLIAFAKDYKEKKGILTNGVNEAHIFTSRLSQWHKFENETFEKLEELRQNLTLLFLFSTDFFRNGADETLPVKYLRLYDPYSGCANPLARLD